VKEIKMVTNKFPI